MADKFEGKDRNIISIGWADDTEPEDTYYNKEENITDDFLAGDFFDLPERTRSHEETDTTAVDGFKEYLKSISGYSVLTFEEASRLTEQAQAGDKAARNDMIQHNQKLVVSIAKKYYNQGLSPLDLIQEGNLGLMKAIEKYDPSTGYQFSTYATYWIKKYITEALNRNRYAMYVPDNAIADIRRKDRAKQQLTMELGRAPRDEEIAEATGLSVQKLVEIKSYLPEFVDLNASVGDDGDTTRGDLIPDETVLTPEEQSIRSAEREEVHMAMSRLTEQEKTVLGLLYGFYGQSPLFENDIGRKLLLSREKVVRIKKSALFKMGRMLKTA